MHLLNFSSVKLLDQFRSESEWLVVKLEKSVWNTLRSILGMKEASNFNFDPSIRLKMIFLPRKTFYKEFEILSFSEIFFDTFDFQPEILVIDFREFFFEIFFGQKSDQNGSLKKIRKKLDLGNLHFQNPHWKNNATQKP